MNQSKPNDLSRSVSMRQLSIDLISTICIMQNLILSSLSAFSVDIKQRIQTIDDRLKSKRPGFRSARLNLISNEMITLEPASKEVTSKIQSSPWKERVREYSELSQNLDELLTQTVNRSVRLRQGLKGMADKLSCEDKSDTLGNYIAIIKIPVIHTLPQEKFSFSEKRKTHSRCQTATLPFESEGRKRSIDKIGEQIPLPIGDWTEKSEILGKKVSETDKYKVRPKRKDTDPGSYNDLPDDYLQLQGKTSRTAIDNSNQSETDLTLNSLSIIKQLEQRQLQIPTVNEYMQEYLQRIKQQQIKKPNPKIQKYLKKMEKKIVEQSNPQKEATTRVRSASILDKQLQTSLQLQLSLREKLLRKIYEMRDPFRYK